MFIPTSVNTFTSRCKSCCREICLLITLAAVLYFSLHELGSRNPSENFSSRTTLAGVFSITLGGCALLSNSSCRLSKARSKKLCPYPPWVTKATRQVTNVSYFGLKWCQIDRENVWAFEYLLLFSLNALVKEKDVFGLGKSHETWKSS